MNAADLQEQLLCYATDLQELMLQHSQLQQRFQAALHAQAGTRADNDLLLNAILHSNTLYLVSTPEGDILQASDTAEQAFLEAGQTLKGQSILSMATPAQQQDVRTLLEEMNNSAPSGAAKLLRLEVPAGAAKPETLRYDVLIIPAHTLYRPKVYWLLQPAVGAEAGDLERLTSIVTLSDFPESLMLSAPTDEIQTVNLPFCQMTGYSAAELCGQPIQCLSSSRHSTEFYQAFWDALLYNDSWTGQFFNRRKNGQIYPEWKSIKAVKNRAGEIISYLSTCVDASNSETGNEQLVRLAYHDTLTGLPNRRLLEDRMTQAIGAAERDKKGLCVLFIDLDRFKPINDELGHDVGDLVLQEIGARLKASVRQGDTVARVGGDEFVILLRNINHPHMAKAVADTLMAKLTEPIATKGHQLTISASIGCASYPQDGLDMSTLLKNADRAMYHAKQTRNQFCVYSASQFEISTP